jgi:hypothetical protein
MIVRMATTPEDREGYVYCMTNEAMPGLVKIGMTCDSPDERARELSSATGVPYPFKVIVCKKVYNPKAKEAAIHELLSEIGFRVNERREFFNCSLKVVDYLFALIDGTEIQTNSLAQTSAVVRKYAVTVVKEE